MINGMSSIFNDRSFACVIAGQYLESAKGAIRRASSCSSPNSSGGGLVALEVVTGSVKKRIKLGRGASGILIPPDGMAWVEGKR
jgi:hypothetical protein